MIVCLCGIVFISIGDCINGNTDVDVDDSFVMILCCRDSYCCTDGDMGTDIAGW